MFGYIYKTTNLINNKIYIGQHQAEEFEKDAYLGSGTILKQAVNMYGKDNFLCELLEECQSKEALDAAEIKWIKYFDSTNLEIGYNLSFGGQGGGTRNLTPVNDDSISLYVPVTQVDKYLKNGYNPGVLPYIRTDAFKEKQRQINTGKVGIHLGDQRIRVYKSDLDQYLVQGYTLGWYDKVPREKIHKSVGSGPKKWMFKDGIYKLISSDYQQSYLQLGWVFKCIPRASSAGHRQPISDTTRRHLSEAHKGKHPTQRSIDKQREKVKGRIIINKDGIKKHIFEINLPEYLSEGWAIGTIKHLDKRSRKVVCYETQEIFDSITEASRAYPKCGGVKRCLKSNYSATAGGYHWYFVDDLNRYERLEQALANIE